VHGASRDVRVVARPERRPRVVTHDPQTTGNHVEELVGVLVVVAMYRWLRTTATEEALAFPYLSLWGFPEKFYRQPPEKMDEVHGLGASPGVVEGTARTVASLDEFDQVKEGEILVCQMTNPAWVVLFTKIGGLVTDAGGIASHPAVVAREFGIPAVVGTSIATDRIKNGDRVRVNGTSGIVEVLR
jgi:pyruvate,water dikinase